MFVVDSVHYARHKCSTLRISVTLIIYVFLLCYDAESEANYAYDNDGEQC